MQELKVNNSYFKYDGKTFITLKESLNYIKNKKPKYSSVYLEKITVYKINTKKMVDKKNKQTKDEEDMGELLELTGDLKKMYKRS